jgi:16S rRNA (adenine1518-N6/adenine1519-N6)-dimethyltransferase
MYVKPKKQLGQHFLKDENIARKIAGSLSHFGQYPLLLEIGPGMGVLTKYLLQREEFELKVIDIDEESIKYLEQHFSQLEGKIIHADFLKLNLQEIAVGKFGIIGNFPYNISSQILFRILENRDLVPEMVGMFQKEMAQRISASPKENKAYGILSVLTQAFYKVEYLFSVNESVFVPPPKVKSGVIRITRHEGKKMDCDEQLFFDVVKTGFNQRRKTLRNSLKKFHISPVVLQDEVFNLRPEALSPEQFISLTKLIEDGRPGTGDRSLSGI